MSARPFPSYRMFRDHRKKWRWTFDMRPHVSIAASADAYDTREECERMLALLRSSADAPLWIAKLDLADV